MKFAHAIKFSICAFAAAQSVAAFAAGPDYSFVSGTAGLTFSSNALSAFTTSGVSITALAPATYVQPNVALTADSVGTNWDSSHNVTTIALDGGFILNSSSVAGAQAKISNLTLDAATGSLYGDVATQSWTNATLGSYTGKSVSHLQLFTGTESGNFNIDAGNGSISANVNNLFMTSAAIPVLGDALGVAPFLYNAIFPTLNFGNATGAATFKAIAAVPEPESVLLMGLGLGALALVKRTRHASNKRLA